MINYFYETSFDLEEQEKLDNWIERIAISEGKTVGEVSYIFCDDEYLHKINLEFLKHDTYTDIISFDNTVGNQINGDIFISVERIEENAKEYAVDFIEELRRVMAHGVLHFCGFKDKTEKESIVMRKKEDEKLLMFHVEH